MSSSSREYSLGWNLEEIGRWVQFWGRIQIVIVNSKICLIDVTSDDNSCFSKWNWIFPRWISVDLVSIDSCIVIRINATSKLRQGPLLTVPTLQSPTPQFGTAFCVIFRDPSSPQHPCIWITDKAAWRPPRKWSVNACRAGRPPYLIVCVNSAWTDPK